MPPGRKGSADLPGLQKRSEGTERPCAAERNAVPEGPKRWRAERVPTD